MEAILIKNGRKIRGKLAEIMVSKGLAKCELEFEDIQEEFEFTAPEEIQIVPDQKASEVKKQGRPKGTQSKPKAKKTTNKK